MVLALLGVFLVSFTLYPAYIYYAKTKKMLDIPNARSSHTTPTPRGGGVIFALLWIFLVFLSCKQGWIDLTLYWLLVPSLSLITVIGFLDDCKSLPVSIRLLLQIFSVGIFAFYLQKAPSLQLGVMNLSAAFVVWPVILLSLLWTTNLYNFMDGLDGLAAIEALFVFGTGSYLLWAQGSADLAMMSFAACVVLIPFLLWNWPKARVFMGDAGSYFLGFLVGTLGILGEKQAKLPIGFWVILFGVFWFDATLTLLRRYLYKQKIWTAHRLHAYQRLHQAGWSHKAVLCGLIAVNTGLSGIALIAYHFDSCAYGLLASCLLLLALYIGVEKISPFAIVKN